MATTGDVAQTSPSSGYGGGGVGGKFDKRSYRRNRSTPYDRPTTALRNPSWVSKLLVDPAKKFIASSANAFFSSVFRKNQHPPLCLPESNPESTDRIQAPVLHDEDPLAGADDHNSRGEDKSGVLELEELLKQKSFTRSEIDHLTNLLRSKAVDLPAAVENDVNTPETFLLKSVTDIQEHKEYRESPLAGNGLKIERTQSIVSTPAISSRVLDEDIASPTELAKAYMNRLPSKVSPSTLSRRSQSIRNDGDLLSNSPFTPTSFALPLVPKTSGHFELGKNGFTTPRSRGRSAVYSMAHTPYSRVHPSTSGKAGGPSEYLFRSPTLSVQDGKLGSKKRGNSELDDLGSGGPMRRIRQRNGLVSDKAPFSSRLIYGSKEVLKPSSLLHKNSFANDWTDMLAKTQMDKAANAPSTSFHVHPRCSEVAAKILQHLENISPKEKSAESKLKASGERSSPSKLTTEMLIRPAPNNLQNAGSSNMLWSVKDHQKLDSSSNRELAGFQEGTSGINENEDQKGPQKSYFQREMMNKEAEVSAKRVFTVTETSDSATISAAQESPKFDSMNNAHKGSPSLSGDTCRKGLAPERRVELYDEPSQQFDFSKSTKDKNPVVGESSKTPPEPVFAKASSIKSFGDGTASFSSLPSSTTKVETVEPPRSIPAFEKPKKAEESSFMAISGKAPDTKAFFSMQPKSLSSFSFKDGTGLLPQVPVSSKHDDGTAHEEAKSIEKIKPVQFGTFGANTSSSTPAFSIFDNSKSKNNGTAGISFSSSPLISTDFTNQVVATNFASSATTSSSSATAFKFGSSDKTSTSFDAGVHVMETKSEKGAIGISPAGGGGGSAFGSGATGSSIFGSTATDPSHSQGIGKESISGLQSSGFGLGSATTVSKGTTTFQFGSSSSSPIFGNSGLVPFTFGSTPPFSSSSSSASNLFTSSQTNGLSSTNSSSESKSVVSAIGGASNIFGFAATTPPTSGAGGFNAPNTFGFSSGSLTTSVSSTVSSTSSVAPIAFNFGANNTGSSASSFSGKFTSRLSSSTDNSPVAPNWQNHNSSSAAVTFNSPSSTPVFSFAAAAAATSAGVSSFASPTTPMFGNQASSTFQMNNTDDSMAEDTFQQSSNPTVPMLGQPPTTASSGGFTFNSTVQSSSSPFQFSGQQPSQNAVQNSPFQFNGQSSQGALQNSPFQGTGSLEFNGGGGGGSFVFGSGGEKSSGRKIVKVNRSKHRKK